MYKLFILITLSCSIYLSNGEWVLEWQDEFDGNTVNLDNWAYSDMCEGKTPSQPWGNHELQCYANDKNNVRVEKGNLVLTATPLNTPQREHNYTSGKLIGKKGFTYGKFEMRGRVPKGKHLWPAFWMLPKDFVYGSTFAAS
ncbi:unnamed protein product, partial [Oppiella nova]